MSMRFKIMGILLFILTGYILLSYGVQRLVILPSYARLEQEGAGKDVSRCIEALRRELAHLDAVTHDWAAWDDTYAFVKDGNPHYPKSNLLPQTFTDNRINLLYILDAEQNVLWGEIRDETSGDIIGLPDLPEGILRRNAKLFSNTEIESTISGMLQTSGGPLMLSSRPITTSDHTGAVIGHLTMGRFIDQGFVRMLEDQTHIRHRYRTVGRGPSSNGGKPFEDGDGPADGFRGGGRSDPAGPEPHPRHQRGAAARPRGGHPQNDLSTRSQHPPIRPAFSGDGGVDPAGNPDDSHEHHCHPAAFPADPVGRRHPGFRRHAAGSVRGPQG